MHLIYSDATKQPSYPVTHCNAVAT